MLTQMIFMSNQEQIVNNTPNPEIHACIETLEINSAHFERVIDDNQIRLKTLEAKVNEAGGTLDIPDFAKEKEEIIAERDSQVAEI